VLYMIVIYGAIRAVDWLDSRYAIE
jgi:hypothetical protein